MATRHQLGGELAVLVQFRVCLGNDEITFLDCRKVKHVISDLTVDHPAIRRLEKTVAVGARIHGQRVDQADVRTFRSLDRTQATIMRGVHVANLEAGTLTGQTTRAQCRNAALVGHFRQRVVLIHELRQLRGAEELLDRRGHGLRIDQILRTKALAFGHAQSLAHGALDTHKTDAELIFGHLSNRANATIAEMVDVIHRAVTVTDIDQHLEHRKNIVPIERARTLDLLTLDATIEFHPAHGRQVVTFCGEKQVLEQILRRIPGRRLARAHHLVDFPQRLELARSRIDAQRAGDIWTLVQIVDIQNVKRLDLGLSQVFKQLGRDFIVAFGQQLTGLAVDDVVGKNPSDQVIVADIQRLDAGSFDLLDMPCRDATILGNDDITALVGDVCQRCFTAQPRRHQVELGITLAQRDARLLEKCVENQLVLHAQSTQQDRDRQLATTVDAGEQAILGIEFEIQPAAAIRNDPRLVQQLTGRMRLASVVIEEHTRRAMHLVDDHPLGAIDDEGTGVGHQRQIAHIDVLLLDFLDFLVLGRAVLVIDDQTHGDAQRGRVGHAAKLALGHVEFRLAELVTYVLQRSVAGVTRNRKHRRKGTMQALELEIGLLRVVLQEFTVGINLG